MDGMFQSGGLIGGGLRRSGRRRPWSAARKAAIVAESFVPGTKVSTVAARHGVNPTMLSAWRGQASPRDLTRGSTKDTPFVPVTVVAAMGRQSNALADVQRATGAIEIVLGDASIRVAKGVDTATLSRVLAAVRGGRR